MSETQAPATDVHSFGNPHQIKVIHVALNLDVDFAQKKLRGHADLTVERARQYREGPLVLDTRNLSIEGASTSREGQSFVETQWSLGTPDKILGTPLTVQVPPEATVVRISYSTSPDATGLQWLTPAQTAGKKHPFLYSQSQAIHARSWIPLQDSPGVRVTYSATIRTPKELLAVMSADNNPDPGTRGTYSFRMPNPIPAYLIALAAGDLQFKAMSKRTGVYAEPPVLERAAREFEDTEQMMQAAESLYGPYKWDRYDLLVLPPSFPFGGMENPRLTFVTPTVIAGDKSLVSLIAHELAHSWSGNLVTNGTWRDFWLNEGFTVYFERRIQEKVYGRDRSEMEALLEKQGLEREMKTLPPKDQILHIDLKGRDPDDGFTQIPYVKGMLFLRRLEELYGRTRFDPFLRTWFEVHAFRSVTTDVFLEYLRQHLLAQDAEIAKRVDVTQWTTAPGLPPDTPQPQSDALERARKAAESWLQGKTSAGALPVSKWSTQEWLQFLTALPQNLGRSRMAELDAAFRLTSSGNSEILSEWLQMAVRAAYEPAYPRLDQFLISVGRRKYLKPLYTELAKTEAGKKHAQAV